MEAVRELLASANPLVPDAGGRLALDIAKGMRAAGAGKTERSEVDVQTIIDLLERAAGAYTAYDGPAGSAASSLQSSPTRSLLGTTTSQRGSTPKISVDTADGAGDDIDDDMLRSAASSPASHSNNQSLLSAALLVCLGALLCHICLSLHPLPPR